MNLSDLGWTPHFEYHFTQLDWPDLRPARVTRQERHQYHALHEDGRCTATLLGRLAYGTEDAASLPAVGDWVALDLFDEHQAVIHEVLPRTGAFSRKTAGSRTRQQIMAANVDVAFLVSGLDHDFNVRRIERYVVQSAGSGARPVIVLNKADLCADLAARIAAVRRAAPDIDVVELSAQSGEGLEALDDHLAPGRTVVFLGSSGVGKSTLVNRLLGDDVLATQAVRADDSRGRHTTTRRELFVLPGGGLVIDTPGLRELQLWGDEADLGAAFPDVEALAESCRFRDCTHDGEPGCAVRAAVDEDELGADRFASYLKLQAELQYLERRQDEAAQRQQGKRFGRMRKRINRDNPKRL